MSELKPFFVVNLRSAGGETGRRWDVQLRPQIVEHFPRARWAFTAGVGQASRLAEAGWKAGADMVVAVGGDGTVNEVVNGLMGELLGEEGHGLPGSQGAAWEAPAAPPPLPILGHLPRGTGCDFARSIGMPKDLRSGLELLAAGRDVTSDVGEIQFTRSGGEHGRRFFINIASAGISGDVVNRVNRSSKQLGGFISFLSATVASNLAYESPKVTIRGADGTTLQVALRVLFVCNAQYCGGGMWVGRGARIDDGLFKAVAIDDPGLVKALLQGGALYSGKLESLKEATVFHASEITVQSDTPVLVECDGEQPGILPATYRVRSGALRLRLSPQALVLRDT